MITSPGFKVKFTGGRIIGALTGKSSGIDQTIITISLKNGKWSVTRADELVKTPKKAADMAKCFASAFDMLDMIQAQTI